MRRTKATAVMIVTSLLAMLIMGVAVWRFTLQEAAILDQISGQSVTIAKLLIATKDVLQDYENSLSQEEHDKYITSIHSDKFISQLTELFSNQTGIMLKQTKLGARNDQNSPDLFEIKQLKIMAADKTISEIVELQRGENGDFVRFMQPVYIKSECIPCHGGIAGETDATGYEKEGMKIGDLGGAVSVKIKIDYQKQFRSVAEMLVLMAAMFLIFLIGILLINARLGRARALLGRTREDLRQLEVESNLTSEDWDSSWQTAMEIHLQSLPASFPFFRGIEFCGKYLASKNLGADYYSVFKIDENRFGVYILDVSGQGPSAVLYAQTIARVFSTNMDQHSLIKEKLTEKPYYRIVQPNKVIERLNNKFPSSLMNQHVSLFYGIIDISQEVLEFCSAGHIDQVVISKDKIVTRLKASGTPAGILSENTEYRISDPVKFQKGDRILLFTNGIANIRSQDGESYGLNRLIEEIKEQNYKPMADQVNGVVDQALLFAPDRQYSDDIAILGISISD